MTDNTVFLSQRRGMTLMEVVIGLVLLATLLVGTMVALGRHAQQIRLGRIRLEALRAADTVLATWFSEDGQLPILAEDVVPGNPNFVWRTTPLGETPDEPFYVQIVRCELFYREAEDQRRVSREDDAFSTKPLVSIDLAAPSPRL